MSTELLGVSVNDVGNPILPVNNPAGEKAFYKLFFQTEVGKKLLPLLTEAVNDRVLEITNAKQAQGREITLDYLSQIIEDLLAIKDPSLFPADEPEPESVDTRERNADGRFKSEFQTFSETHSSADCANRAKVDAEYRTWRQSQYRAEGLQEGAYRLAGTPERSAMSDERASLSDFVAAYNRAPSQNLRPKGGFVILDVDHKYAAAEFTNLVTRSAKLGLI